MGAGAASATRREGEDIADARRKTGASWRRGRGTRAGRRRGRAITAGSDTAGTETLRHGGTFSPAHGYLPAYFGHRLAPAAELRAADRRHLGAIQAVLGGVGDLAVLQDQAQQVRAGVGVEGIAMQLVAGDLQLAGVSAHQSEIRLGPG